jgi:hypothetical protein
VSKKNKTIIFLIILFLLFIFNSSFVFAALEITSYKDIGFGIPVEGDLPTYIRYLFGFLCYIAGTIATISFAIGAIQLIMGASNPSLANDAKDRMKGSVLGLILTVSAVLILRTINPALETITMTPLTNTEGIFYTNGPDYKSAPTGVSNSSDIPKGYEELAYNCSKGPFLLIWKFPKSNFMGNDKNYSGVIVVRKKCGEKESLSGVGSFKTAYETPGIYYCTGGCSESGTVCSGYMSEPNYLGGTLPDSFKNNLRSVRIVNNLSNDSHYGIIVHNTSDSTRAGICSQPLFSTNINKEIECFSNTSPASSSTIFLWNSKGYVTFGQGVDFYSEPFGWGKGAQAGKYSLGSDIIKNYWTGEAQSLALSYIGIERPNIYKQIYKNFKQRPGSIKINGNYMVTLWSGSSCQTFFDNVTNLKSTEITASIGNIEKINVIPIKQDAR